MKKRFLVMTVLVCCAVIFAGTSAATAGAPRVGEAFPVIEIPMPKDRTGMDYLGFQRGQTFEISRVKADLVILEVLSMYCPYCQAEAPKVNRFYEMIESDPGLKGSVKIIGIAAGNTPLEAELFQNKYAIPFPVIPDGDFVLHQALGEVRTPYFIGVRIEDGAARVVYSQLGSFEDPESFLSLMLEASGLSVPGEQK